MSNPKTDKGFEGLEWCLRELELDPALAPFAKNVQLPQARLELTRAREMRELLETAYHCLQSYVYGNSDPTLAKECCAAVRRCWRRNEKCIDNHNAL